MGNLQLASLSLAPLIPILQSCASAVPAVIGVLGTLWATSIRRTVHHRFEQGVSRETNAELEKRLAQIALKEQELRHLAVTEDDLIKRINMKYESYSKSLEFRIENLSQEMDELNNRIKILELENRNTIRENLSQAKYITILVDKILSLGGEVPERTREFNV